MNIRKKGFTLVELIIVVGIIAVLVILAISYFRGQIFKGNDARRKSDMNRIKIALEEYEKDHDCYPPPDLVVCDPGTGLQPYIDKIPCDPTTRTSYYYEYDESSCPSWYKIYTKLDTDGDLGITPYIGPGGVYNFVQSSTNAPATVQTTPTPTPVSSSDPEPGTYYGCKSGACVQISWDPERPGPECDPNYQNSSCYDQCSLPSSECLSWH